MTRKPRERKHVESPQERGASQNGPRPGWKIHPSLGEKPVKRINESPEWALDED
jgi:hypothetical protein